MSKFDFTTATRSELSTVWKAIAQEMGDDRFFTTKELDHLPKVLDSEEQVLAFSSGLHKGNTWLIVLTGERILFLDKGMIYGLRTSSIELERVNNFDYEKGLLFGSISIGSNAEIYEITNVWKKTVEPFTRKLREAIKAKQQGVALLSPGTQETQDEEASAPQEDPLADYQTHDYEVYTPPVDESGPLALGSGASSNPDQGTASGRPSVRDASLERMRRAGIL